MAVYKGFDTLTSADNAFPNQQLRQASSQLTASAQAGDTMYGVLAASKVAPSRHADIPRREAVSHPTARAKAAVKLVKARAGATIGRPARRTDRASSGRVPSRSGIAESGELGSDVPTKTADSGCIPVDRDGADPCRIRANGYGQIVAGPHAFQKLADTARNQPHLVGLVDSIAQIMPSIREAQADATESFAVGLDGADESAIRHEGIHQGQDAANDHKEISKHLDHSKPPASDMDDKTHLQVERHLEASAETDRACPGTAIYEAPAHTVSSDFAESDLDAEGAAQVRGRYYNVLLEEYGAGAAKRIFHQETENFTETVGAGPTQVPYKQTTAADTHPVSDRDSEHVVPDKATMLPSNNVSAPLPMRPLTPVGTNPSSMPELKLQLLWSDPR